MCKTAGDTFQDNELHIANLKYLLSILEDHIPSSGMRSSNGVLLFLEVLFIF